MKTEIASIGKLKTAEDSAGYSIAFLHGLIHDKGGENGQKLMMEKMLEVASLVDGMTEELRSQQMAVWAGELTADNLQKCIEYSVEELCFNVGKIAALGSFLREHRLALENTLEKRTKKQKDKMKKSKEKQSKASKRRNRG